MAAIASYTQADTVLGRIPGGLKLVATTITVGVDAGTGAAMYTIKPLTRIIAFIARFKKPVGIPGRTVFAAGTAPNQVSINNAATISAGVIEIWSWGV